MKLRMKWRGLTRGGRIRLGILVALGAGAAVSVAVACLWGKQTTWDAVLAGLGTELAGGVVTYLLIERLVGGTERPEKEKADLIAQMGSEVRDVAIAATEELRRRGWLTDGSLRGAHLSGANLSGAILDRADLTGAVLFDVNLTGAYVTDEQLATAKHLTFTTTPDGTIRYTSSWGSATDHLTRQERRQGLSWLSPRLAYTDRGARDLSSERRKIWPGS